MIIGNSGDNLAANPATPLVGATVGNAIVTPATGGGFTVVSKDSAGATAATCSVAIAKIACDK